MVVIYYSNVFIRRLCELDYNVLEYTDRLISSYALLSILFIFLGLSFTLASINMNPYLKYYIKFERKLIVLRDPDIWAGTFLILR